MDAAGINEKVFGIGAFGDFADDGESGEFLHATQPLETFFDDAAVFVENLNGGSGCFDDFGVITADVPRSLAAVVVIAIAGSDFGGVAENDHGAAIDEGFHTAHDFAGDGDWGPRGGIGEGIGYGDSVGGQLSEENAFQGVD